MAKEKPNRSKTLDEIRIELAHAIDTVALYTDPEYLKTIVENKEMLDKLQTARELMVELRNELTKRFGTPAHYED